jgi:hypothetical protein
MTSRRPIPPSHDFAVGNAGAEKPTARPMIKITTLSHTRLCETRSGSSGSNGGPESNGGGAMMSASRGVSCVVSDSDIASNETQDQRPREREMMFACFQLLGRIRSSLMMLHLWSREGIADFAMDPL